MRKLVEEHGLGECYEIDSAGIGGWHEGQLPDVRMRRQGALRGYRLDSRARQIRRRDFTYYDYILAMDNDNVHDLLRLAANDAERRKVHRLSEYAGRFREVTAIPDPYYGGTRDFDYALDLIEDACAGLLRALENAPAGNK